MQPERHLRARLQAFIACPGGVDGRFVRHHRVRGVVQILEEDLPVGMLPDAEHAARDLDLAGRRTVAEIVDGGLDAAEEGLQVRPVLGEACEDEAAIARLPRQPAHGELRVLHVEAGAVVAVADGHRVQRAVAAVAPAVERAAQELARVAVRERDQLRALVGAAIEQHVDRAVGVADHEHRLPPDQRLVIVAGVRHLARVPDIDPGAAEDALHLEVEDGGVGVDRPMHPVRLHQLRHVVRVRARHRAPPVSRRES